MQYINIYLINSERGGFINKCKINTRCYYLTKNKIESNIEASPIDKTHIENLVCGYIELYNVEIEEFINNRLEKIYSESHKDVYSEDCFVEYNLIRFDDLKSKRSFCLVRNLNSDEIEVFNRLLVNYYIRRLKKSHHLISQKIINDDYLCIQIYTKRFKYFTEKISEVISIICIIIIVAFCLFLFVAFLYLILKWFLVIIDSRLGLFDKMT